MKNKKNKLKKIKKNKLNKCSTIKTESPIIKSHYAVNKTLLWTLLISSLLVSLFAIKVTIADYWNNTIDRETSIDVGVEGEVKVDTNSILKDFFKSKMEETVPTEIEEEDVNKVINKVENIIASKNKYKKIFEEEVSVKLKALSEEELKNLYKKVENKILGIKYSELKNNYENEMSLAQLLALKEITWTLINDSNYYSKDINLEELLSK